MFTAWRPAVSSNMLIQSVRRTSSMMSVVGRDPRRVRAARERPHARSGDAIHGHAQLLEHLEHSQVRAAASASAAQHQADALARGGRLAERIGNGAGEDDSDENPGEHA